MSFGVTVESVNAAARKKNWRPTTSSLEPREALTFPQTAGPCVFLAMT